MPQYIKGLPREGTTSVTTSVYQLIVDDTIALIQIDKCLYLFIFIKLNCQFTDDYQGRSSKVYCKTEITEYLNYSLLYGIYVHGVKDIAAVEVFQLHIYWMMTRMQGKMKKWFYLGFANWRRLSTILILLTFVVIVVIAFCVFFTQKRGKSIISLINLCIRCSHSQELLA